MANPPTSFCFFFFFLSSSLFILCCSGTLVGFSYRERGDDVGASETISFLKDNKVPSSHIRIFVTDHRILTTLTYSYDGSLDFYLNESLVKSFIRSKPYALVSWLKTHLVDFLPQVEIKSITASCGNVGQNEIPLVVSALKSIHSVLSKLEVKVSVAFPLSFLKKLKTSHENDLHMILSFIKETNSFVMIEGSIYDRESSMWDNDEFVQSIIKRAILAASIIKDVPLILTIKIPSFPTTMEVSEFSQKVSKSLESTSTEITNRIIALYAEVQSLEEEKDTFPMYRRSLDDTTNPANTIYPTNPTSATPAIITVPSTNPAATPVTPPVPLTPTNPANPGTTPITIPGAQPSTYYPPPSSPTSTSTSTPSVPVVNPIINNNPPPPSNTNNANNNNNNSPAMSGQSWCVAKTGASETALQSALDYACGMGGADCSQIQQSGNCYNPNSLQNHASVAFNSYYQKNPTPTSCDFGGVATLVNVNPSTGSCIYSSSSSSSSSSTSPTTTSSTPTPMPTSSSSSGTGESGYGTPPSVLNSSNPAIYGSESPPNVNTTSSSHSYSFQPFMGFLVLVISFIGHFQTQ